MEKGYIKLSRKFFENDIWLAARKFNDCEAWLDLIQSARFDASETTSLVGGREITWCRGQFPASIRFLSKRWQWGERRVRSFLDKLKERKMITTEDGQGMTVITLTNYEKYNGKDTPKDTAKDTDNILDNNMLQSIVTQVVTQLKTQRSEKGHSDDTNKKKGNKATLVGDSKESLPSETLQPHAERIDYDKLVRYFNEETKGVFGMVRLPLSDTRKGLINARVKTHGKQTFVDMIHKAIESDFLNGQNKKGWRASFDWLIKPTNFEKVISGNYDNNSNNGVGSHRAGLDDDFFRGVAEGISRGNLTREKWDE